MRAWWLWLAGVDETSLPAGAELRFVWTHAPRSWGLFVLVAVVAALLYLVLWLYRREPGEASLRLRLGLAALRAAALLLLLGVFLGPALEVTRKRVVEPYVLLLLDESLSMGIRDRYADETQTRRAARVLRRSPEAVQEDPPTRAALVEAILRREDGLFLKRLARRGKVRVMTYAAETRLRAALGASVDPRDPSTTTRAGATDATPGGLPTGPAVPPLVPTGAETDLARGLRESMRSVAGNPVAAVVLIGDGRATAGEDPLRAAAKLAEAGTPILTVGVGDPTRPPNRRVVSIGAPARVFKEDPYEIRATVAASADAASADSTGVGESGADPGDAFTVELVAQRVTADGGLGPETVIESKTVTPTAPAIGEATGESAGDEVMDETGPLGVGVGTPPREARAEVVFERKPERAGKTVYTVRVPKAEGEMIESDNRRATTVEVLEAKTRVLLVAGSPTWDFRMARNLLLRDRTIDLSVWLQSLDREARQEGNTVIEKLPSTPPELFAYDVLAFIDPDPDEFNEAWIETLRRYLEEHGGGLLWMAGPKYTVKFLALPRTAAMRDLLPVRGQGERAELLQVLGGPVRKGWPVRVTPVGADHPLLRLGDEAAADRARWGRLPSLYWTYPVTEAKPGAQTLLVHTDPATRVGDKGRPLLVTGRYGRGRTLFLGFGGTWRWRRADVEIFDRFWVQAIRYLMEGRLARDQAWGRLETDRDRYALGQTVRVLAELRGPDLEPWTAESVTATAVGPDGSEELTLEAAPARPGTYRAILPARRLGAFEIRLRPPGAPPEAGDLTRGFTVEAPHLELADPRLDRAGLRALAQRTGGRYLEVDEADEVPDLIPDRRETLLIPDQPRTLWDRPWVLVLFGLLVSLEWALRRRARML